MSKIKKYFEPVMLLLALIFGALAVLCLYYMVMQFWGQDGRITDILALLAVSGFFLGFYGLFHRMEQH